MIVGIDVGSEAHYARAFDWRNYEYTKKPLEFSNTETGFQTLKAWMEELLRRMEEKLNGILHIDNLLAGYAIVANDSGRHNGESRISYRGRKRLRYVEQAGRNVHRKVPAREPCRSVRLITKNEPVVGRRKSGPERR